MERESRPARNRAAETKTWESAVKAENTRRLAHAARIAARLDGCRCDPDVVVTGVTVGGVRHVHIEHDAWCVLGGDAA